MVVLRDKIGSILKEFDASTDPDSLLVASVGVGALFVIESQTGILDSFAV
jgi:hypothetical protein